MKLSIISAISVIIIFSGGFLNEAFAIDYRDSTGYTPSWALGKGYHSVLMTCTDLIGDYSRDGNWCFEWTAYVLDQGVENFPESTKSTSSKQTTYNLTERICTENKICVFPGEFLKYKNTDTYDDFSEIATIEFKNKINSNSIQFFSNGFGSKPLTYNLNLNTGIETHDEYSSVNRPFNLIEPIPMKVGQKVSQYMAGYYESTISDEKTVNLKELGLMDVTRVLMMAKTDLGGGDSVIRIYDKETGVLITNVEKYHLDDKEFVAGIVLVDTNIFSVPTTLPSKIQSSTVTNSNTLKDTTIKKPNSVISGTYLEQITIKNQNFDYTITAKLGPKSPDTSSIRITAENECPFKKQIFQKDFQNRLGTDVSFSFHQLSQSKPSECTIHFTLSSFQGQELETIAANYYLELPKIKKQSTSNTNYNSLTISDSSHDSSEFKKNIPIWVKNNAKWWADGTIDDNSFANGIQYLLKEKIIDVPVSPVNANSDQKIPDWIRNTAQWWADDMISEEEFVKAIQFLVKNGMIVVSFENESISQPLKEPSPTIQKSQFDPVIVQSAKENIPGMQSLPREILNQCINVNSYSKYETFMLAIALMGDEIVKNIDDIDLVLTTLELAGYDEHPEVGKLIKDTRNISLSASNCIDRVISRYG
jgi:hypothetical protein